MRFLLYTFIVFLPLFSAGQAHKHAMLNAGMRYYTSIEQELLHLGYARYSGKWRWEASLVHVLPNVNLSTNFPSNTGLEIGASWANVPLVKDKLIISVNTRLSGYLLNVQYWGRLSAPDVHPLSPIPSDRWQLVWNYGFALTKHVYRNIYLRVDASYFRNWDYIWRNEFDVNAWYNYRGYALRASVLVALPTKNDKK